MAALFFWLWVAGGVPAAVLGEVVQAESPRTRRAGRILFALLLGFDLLLAAAFFSVGQSAGVAHMTRSLWWATIILAGVPLALASGFAVRRGYVGHLLALAAATLTTAALYLVFPLGFIPRERGLTGLGRFAHDHHVLGIAILFVPTLILLLNELRWKQVEAPEPTADEPSLRDRLRAIPRGNLVAAVIVFATFVFIAGANGDGELVGLGVLLVGSAMFLWHRDRVATRSVLRELRPPEKS